MTGEPDPALREAAIAFARANKKRIAQELTDPKVFLSEEHPVSVFMAGSPGAGKTESSKELVAQLESEANGSRILRIDPDDLRSCFPGYDGRNSWLFQGAVSIVVERILDHAFKQSQSFLLDGTLAYYDQASKNIQRSLDRGRTVQILFVYQDPVLAWQFVRARELEEQRRIPVEAFIEQYFQSREVVNRVKRELGPRIKVDLLLKPNNSSNRVYQSGIEQIDYHVPEQYDPATLREILSREVD